MWSSKPSPQRRYSNALGHRLRQLRQRSPETAPSSHRARDAPTGRRMPLSLTRAHPSAWDLWAPMATLRVTRATNGRVRPPQLPPAHPGLVPFPLPPQPKLRRQGRREAPRTSPSRTEQTAPATPDGSDEQAPSPRRRAGRSPPTALASRPANLPRPTRQLAPELLPRTTRDPLRQPQRQGPPRVPARPSRPGSPFSGVPSQPEHRSRRDTRGANGGLTVH